MFDSLLEWFKKPLEWFSWLFSEMWRQAIFGVWSIWSVVLVFFSMVVAALDWLQDQVGAAVNALSGLQLGSYDLSLSSAQYYLEFANTFLPVSEMLAFGVAYIALLSVLLVYRTTKSIKSWIWAG